MKLINSTHRYLHLDINFSDYIFQKFNVLKGVWEYLALISILGLGFVVRYPLVLYNLPVSANVDERLSLAILYRFENVGLNPEWFHYPSFFYYLTFFWCDFWGDINSALFYGRILNLLFGCGLAVSVFFLSQYLYKSKTASLIAAALTMFSPLLIESGSYIITDILLAILSVIALLLLMRFFETAQYKFWLMGAFVIGLAISTKYTALIIAITYVIIELINYKSLSEKSRRNWLLLNKGFTHSQLTGIFFILSLILFAIVILFPHELLMSILQTSGDLNSTVDAKDIIFFNSLRKKVLYLGILSLICTVLSYRFPRLFERFGLFRIYMGIGIITVGFLVASPYVLVSWKTFIYDFGSELKHNALHTEDSQWLAYIRYYFDKESLVVLAFFIIGIFMSFKRKINLGVLLTYLIIYYIVIGSSTRSFPRYLVPALPILFAISGFGIDCVGSYLNKYRKGFRSIVLLFVIVVIGFEVYAKLPSSLFQNYNKDEIFNSYQFVKKYNPSQVYFSGDSPNVELRIAGFEVEKIPEKALFLDNYDFLTNLKPNQLIILDGAKNTQIYPEVRQQFKLLWSTNRGGGQYIYKIH